MCEASIAQICYIIYSKCGRKKTQLLPTIINSVLDANLWEHKLTSEMIYTALLSLKLCIGSVSKRGEIAKNEKMHQDKKLLKKEKTLPVPTLKY